MMNCNKKILKNLPLRKIGENHFETYNTNTKSLYFKYRHHNSERD